MTRSRDPGWYRQEAARFRQMAAAVTDSTELRDSYLALSLQYERLAQVLEKAALSPKKGVGVEEVRSMYSRGLPTPSGRASRPRAVRRPNLLKLL